jgi:hypothetical protein
MNYRFLFLIWLLSYWLPLSAQEKANLTERTKYLPLQYWNSENLLNPFRFPFPDKMPEYIDLDKDGDPDLLKAFINGLPVLWIDDDDDMNWGDLSGDIDNDCLMVDKNGDGNYGHYADVYIDWVDNNGDGNADMQIYAEYADESRKDRAGGPGHLMLNIDLDRDNIMNYIDWNNFHVRGWLHDGQADFYEDYHGKTFFLKIHTSPEKINDPRLNWENPFLFYDPDNDGLTEYAIRLLDQPIRGTPEDKHLMNLTGKISWVSLSYDLDNDNSQGNEFDYDLTISYRGEGFDYLDQVHHFPKMRGLPESDHLFMDPRVRQLTELIYPDHESAKNLIFHKGNWDEVYFSYDEDDDCNRWERVELYDLKDPYITGKRKGGLDDNPQSDVVGDRGEWDMDNSGKGNLYIGKFDGRLHLYGAEIGYWRIDQNAFYYQGMGGLYDGYGPERLSNEVDKPFPIVKYTDNNNNGFFDKIEYDIDGDQVFERVVSLVDMEIADSSEILYISDLQYGDLNAIHSEIANNLWKQAMIAVKVAEQMDIETKWYAVLMRFGTTRQQYHNGYWLQFYLYNDLLELANRLGNKNLMGDVTSAYYRQDWAFLLDKIINNKNGINQKYDKTN